MRDETDFLSTNVATRPLGDCDKIRHSQIHTQLASPLTHSILEYYVLIPLVPQHILRLPTAFYLLVILILLIALPPLLLRPLRLFGRLRPLFDALDLLEPKEFLAVQLVELAVDVLDGVFSARDDDVFAVALSLAPKERDEDR